MVDYRKDLLDLDDKGISKAKGVLSRLFRGVLYSMQMNGQLWDTLINRMLDDPHNPEFANRKDRASQKGNMNKALKGDRMTWKTFEKALRFLGIVRIRFEIHVTWQNNTTTVHGVNQEIGGFTEEDYQIDSDEDAAPVVSTQPTPTPVPQVKGPDRVETALHSVARHLSRIGKIPLRRFK